MWYDSSTVLKEGSKLFRTIGPSIISAIRGKSSMINAAVGVSSSNSAIGMYNLKRAVSYIP